MTRHTHAADGLHPDDLFETSLERTEDQATEFPITILGFARSSSTHEDLFRFSLTKGESIMSGSA